MVNLGTLRTIVGFGLKGLGFFWSFFDKFLCGSLCKNTIEREPIWVSDFYIASTPVSGGVATYPPPESIVNPGDTPCTEKTMSCDIGVILLELLGYDTLNEFYWNSPLINECTSKYSNSSDVFLDYIRRLVLPEININACE